MFAVGGRIAHADIPRICTALQRLLELREVELVICEVGGVVDPDAATVDALSRLQLTAKWFGCALRLRHVSPELHDLIAFMGLGDALGTGDTPCLRAT